MSLLSKNPSFNYVTTNSSVGADAGTQAGTTVTSGSAHTYGSWTQIHAGLTYQSSICIVRINAVETSANVISATTLNAYIDIGIGPDSSNVTVILEKLGGSQAQGLGIIYYIPVMFPPDTIIWARHQNTQASAKAGVEVTFYGGVKNVASFPSFSKMVALGAATSTTEGTTFTGMGSSGSEGSWVEIVSSTSENYGGGMISSLFASDTSLQTGLHITFDMGLGGSGSEISIGENAMHLFTWSSAEQRSGISLPVYYNIPSGSRITLRGSRSVTADSNPSIMFYGLI